jgi:integrase
LSEGKRYMANRVFRTLQGLFRWAREDRKLIEGNPCAGITCQKEQARTRALTDAELERVWGAFAGLSFQPRSAFKLLLLTGQRLNEVVGAKWAEIDFERALWTLPAHEQGRSKMRKDVHLVPLSPAALAIFAELKQMNGSLPTVFRSKGKGAGTAAPTRSMVSIPKMHLDRALAGMAQWRTHDLRRTCRTGLSMLGVEPHVAELVIGHTLPRIVAVYDRYIYLAEKRDALNRWAAHVLQAVGEAPRASAEVVALRA